MSEPSSGIRPRTVVAAILAVLALVFVFQNNQRGDIDFLFWSLSMPAWIWLLVVFAAGVLVGLMVPRARARKKEQSATH